ncbi:glycosyltransferase family 4 protein [Calothrix sp. FACHB-1219]|uniref:glycosyltransferase family 4 protein n=1 Tax=unclassified Calothrix TaxID=2619626 RepID=UPI001682D7CD|nr:MULTISPECIES: glycosyltransferase family 4 protein [unclassified Calothrix]MBD2204668.1 glycosyltransferase family 4 protein [Calothrix sp. FACHB-168]MBD2216820.1 glycosyltransferase family 4 protein [Calothrix sp. FACHB-1219]
MSVLKSLTDSYLKNKCDFVIGSSEKLSESKSSFPAIIVHDSCNWQRLLKLLIIKLKNPQSKIVIHEHHYSEGFVQCNVPNKFRFYLMLKLSYGLADWVVAISSGQQKWLQENHLVSAKKLVLIQPCRALNDFFTVPPKPIEKPLIVGAYGRFHPQKGFDTLLEAMKLIPDSPIKLRIAGEGDEESKLKQLAQGLNNVEFIGRVDNVPEFLQTCDAVAIPSRWEPMGLVGIEAKAAGRFVIATEIDGLTEQVSHCGVLVPPQDPEKLAQAIASIPEQDLEALGKIARQSVEGAWEKYLDEWDTFLSQITQ